MGSAIRHFAATASDSFLARFAFHAALLPAGKKSLFLRGRGHAFHLLPGLEPDLAYLLMFLLWCQRGVRADAGRLRSRFALDRLMPLHHRLVDASDLPARLQVPAPRGLRLPRLLRLRRLIRLLRLLRLIGTLCHELPGAEKSSRSGEQEVFSQHRAAQHRGTQHRETSGKVDRQEQPKIDASESSVTQTQAGL